MKIGAIYMAVFIAILLNCTAQAQDDTSESSNDEPGYQADTIVIRFGEGTPFFTEEGSLRIDEIEQDHRCPIDVQCVWGGNAKIKLELSFQQNMRSHFTLNTNNRFTTDTIINDLKISLVDLQPSRKSKSTIAAGHYRATVIISKTTPTVQIQNRNPFIGLWKLYRSQIIIADGGKEGYYIFFGGDAHFIKTDVNSDSITGYNTTGNFTIKMISSDPPQFLYSEDGLGGHFEPAINKLYEKEISNNAKMLVGKWQSIDDSKKMIEYTSYDLIHYYAGQQVAREPYTLLNKCMNSAEINRNISFNHEYISVINSDMCWDMVNVDKDSLTISYNVTGELSKYTRAKEPH